MQSNYQRNNQNFNLWKKEIYLRADDSKGKTNEKILLSMRRKWTIKFNKKKFIDTCIYLKIDEKIISIKGSSGNRILNFLIAGHVLSPIA